jgi:sugar phosphate isomerase/epimerase
MKFSFSANAFRKYTLEETVAAISRAGFVGMELMCDVPHAWPYDLLKEDVSSIKKMMRVHNLSIANLNAFMMCAVQDFHHPSWIEPDESFRKIRVDYTLRCIELAADLGVETISTEPGGPLDGMKRDFAMEVFMEGLDKAVRHADENGVTILIEPEPGLLIETSEDFINFVDKFGAHRVGLNFDVGHFYCVGEDPATKVIELKDHIRHFHLEDIPESREHRHIQLGEGGVDIHHVLSTIDRIGYQGFVTVELYPYQDSAPEIAKQSMAFLNTLNGGRKR